MFAFFFNLFSTDRAVAVEKAAASIKAALESNDRMALARAIDASKHAIHG